MNRIWIYQASRFFKAEELEVIQSTLDSFVSAWKAHGTPLVAQARVLYNLFIVLQVDESVAQATGCSVDKSVHLLKSLEQQLNISLFDRLSIVYKDAFGSVHIVSKGEFQDLIASGEVTVDTIVFNNMLTDGADFPQRWEVPLRESWHAKVFQVPTV